MNIDQNLISSLDKASAEDKAEILALIEELEEVKKVEAARDGFITLCVRCGLRSLTVSITR